MVSTSSNTRSMLEALNSIVLKITVVSEPSVVALNDDSDRHSNTSLPSKIALSIAERQTLCESTTSYLTEDQAAGCLAPKGVELVPSQS